MNNSWQIIFGILVVVSPLQIFSRLLSRVENEEDYRLPNNTVPLHYDIKLIPYIENEVFTFDGEVTIEVNIVEETTSIVLHANEITIKNDTVLVYSLTTNYTITDQTYNPDLHFYVLTFATVIPVGSYFIFMAYNGTLDSDMQGFYRSYYTTSSGETRWLAATQFEPVYARQAFPCFDEPALKARFTISIAHWTNQTALSNEAAERTSDVDEDTGGRVWTLFATTPLMSTYLVAFVVSDFQQVSNNDLFRIWSRPDALETATYALKVGEEILDDLNDYTQHFYNTSFSKMDQIAIPDFSAGAMENWGLVTYRERLLLVKENVATSRLKQSVATVIAHEFAHQWFGNLVSPMWWKYLWLNEGFATYFEYFTTSSVETTWRLSDQFTVAVMHSALLTDSLDTSHPISEDVYSPSQINAIFDTISYNKAGCVIRMMANFLGESVFRLGLQQYLQNRAFEAAEPDDLWAALTSANSLIWSPVLDPQIDIKTVMDTWTNQKGYPVVTVTRNYTAATTEISQERFLLKGRGSSNDTTEYRWWIPINYIYRTSYVVGSTAPSDWIRAQDESIMISGFPTSGWVILNCKQTGFYRVNYDDTNWGLIADYLNSTLYSNIDVSNRAQLIDDALNLARAGYVKYSVALPITRYLNRETEYPPWVAAFTGFTYLNTMLANSTGYKNFTTYVLSRVEAVHSILGVAELDGDEHVDKLLRPTVNSWACRMGSTSCQETAEELLLNFYGSSEPSDSFISADLKTWVYCEGLRRANSSVWNFLWNRFLTTDYSGEQTLILSSLGCSENEDILNNYLALSISANSGIRTQDAYSVFTSVYSSSPSNVNVAFNFLVNNWAAISEFYGGMNSIGNILQGLAARVVSNDQLEKLKNFVDDHQDDLGVAAAAAERAIEVAEENLSWLELYEDDILDWIAQELVSESESNDQLDDSSNESSMIRTNVILATILYVFARYF